MGYWSIIVPEAATNTFLDPQFGKADPDTEWDIAGDGAPDFTRDTSYMFVGSGSALADFGGGAYVTIYDSITVTATDWTLSAMVRRSAGGAVTSSHCQARWNTADADWDSITLVRDGWYRCVKTATPTAGAREMGVKCLEDDMYVDALQLENAAYRTTYIDGEQEGCTWAGEKHGSTSSRSATSRAGGRIYDFDDLGVYVTNSSGTGMPPLSITRNNYSIVPGSLFNSTRIHDRSLMLTIHAAGSSWSNLHSVRQTLIDYLRPDIGEGDESFILRYSGATVEKEIKVRYEAGLEVGPWKGFTESIILRLWAEDPFWYSVGETSQALDVRDTDTVRLIMARTGDTWSAMGPPDAAGTYTNIQTLLMDQFATLQVGGNFTEFDNDANADYHTTYADGAWTEYGALVGIIRAIAERADGRIYVGGDGIIGGAAHQVGYWSGAAWTGYFFDFNCYTLAFDPSTGYLWGGGADWIRYQVPGGADTGVDINVGTITYALAFNADGSILYAAGDWAAGPGGDAYISKYTGAAWVALGTGLNATGRCLLVDQADNVYVGGDFTTANGVTCNYIAKWNGTTFEPLGSGFDAACHALAMDDDGNLYAGGAFTTADGISAPSLAMWDGSRWHAIDVELPGTPTVRAIVCDGDNLYVGFNTTGTAYFPGSTTVTNNGTRKSYPKFHFERDGGDAMEIKSVWNATTNQKLAFDGFTLLDGEKVEIDLRPGIKTITSNTRGNLMAKMLPTSDFADFALVPGANTIYAYCELTGGPTATAYVTWQDTYWSLD